MVRLSQGISASPVGDILMLLAVILCGMGYAEGAKLSKTLGGWQVISWALVISSFLLFIYFPSHLEAVSLKDGLAWDIFIQCLLVLYSGIKDWHKEELPL
jgi:drug/metabolite transporter (DMT)-like permease